MLHQKSQIFRISKSDTLLSATYFLVERFCTNCNSLWNHNPEGSPKEIYFQERMYKISWNWISNAM
jgi:hypothetical protein